MDKFYLGADLGGTKTHVLVTNQAGQVLGFGSGGPGNHETVGYDGFRETLRLASQQALCCAGLKLEQLDGAGFGIAGYDWPSQGRNLKIKIDSLGFNSPFEMVNDTILGLLAGSPRGWGIAIVSGTGCNCWGWDATRKKIGQVTGGGVYMGEAAGSSELVAQAVKILGYAWTQRGPQTRMADVLAVYAGAKDLADLLEGLVTERLHLGAAAAPLIFKTAEEGDQVAQDLIEWGGNELAELAKGVIRQIGIKDLDFDVVLLGSMFEGGPRLTEPMKRSILAFAPGAHFIRLNVPPVVGAVLLGMKAAGYEPGPEVRAQVAESIKTLK